MRVKLFKPPDFVKNPLSINNLNEFTGKNWQYSTSGKASIFNILQSINTPNKILIPVYICDSVLIPLKKLKIEPIFYDIDKDDLNGSIESIEYLANKHQVKSLLVASLYGNPANLVEIEKYCAEKKILLIDDAAQSYGATLMDRKIGTFGNAGFFSFSPGKATAGHMGAFFWTEEFYNFKHTQHCLSHFLIWLDFYCNRQKCYSYNFLLYKNMINTIKRINLKYTNLQYDNICKFENQILGGILDGVLTYMMDFRKKYLKEFSDEFSKDSDFRIVSAIRGVPNNHKIVLVFDNDQLAKKIISFCISKKITITSGYHLCSEKLAEIPNANAIKNRIVELPIEDNHEQMDYLFSTFREALKTN